MEPMLEPFEERTFRALVPTATPFVRRRRRHRKRRGWSGPEFARCRFAAALAV